ncbi:MAG: SRPBCC family protein [Candidatus Obscuribacter sp.]|nr:SRPBCC family protein [Candidatus Obscuribacter sp.]
MASTTDRIKRKIELKAPLSKIWQALTGLQKFGQWFLINLRALYPQARHSRQYPPHPGYEHVTMSVKVHKIEPQSLFSYYWHPYAVDPQKDYSGEPPTLVEFRLKAIDGGTLLSVSESGFDALPASRRDEAFRMNDGGWAQQMVNIQNFVEKVAEVK